METTCHQGQLYWTDPFGGLRVTFNPRMRVHFDFKLCFTARHPGVRIYRELLESLTLLSEGSENVTKKAVCIKSKGEQLPVLYLETEENQTMTQVNYTVFVNGRKRPRHERIKGKKFVYHMAVLYNLPYWVCTSCIHDITLTQCHVMSYIDCTPRKKCKQTCMASF